MNHTKAFSILKQEYTNYIPDEEIDAVDIHVKDALTILEGRHEDTANPSYLSEDRIIQALTENFSRYLGSLMKDEIVAYMQHMVSVLRHLKEDNLTRDYLAVVLQQDFDYWDILSKKRVLNVRSLERFKALGKHNTDIALAIVGILECNQLLNSPADLETLDTLLGYVSNARAYEASASHASEDATILLDIFEMLDDKQLLERPENFARLLLLLHQAGPGNVYESLGVLLGDMGDLVPGRDILEQASWDVLTQTFPSFLQTPEDWNSYLNVFLKFDVEGALRDYFIHVARYAPVLKDPRISLIFQVLYNHLELRNSILSTLLRDTFQICDEHTPPQQAMGDLMRMFNQKVKPQLPPHVRNELLDNAVDRLITRILNAPGLQVVLETRVTGPSSQLVRIPVSDFSEIARETYSIPPDIQFVCAPRYQPTQGAFHFRHQRIRGNGGFFIPPIVYPAGRLGPGQTVRGTFFTGIGRVPFNFSPPGADWQQTVHNML